MEVLVALIQFVFIPFVFIANELTYHSSLESSRAISGNRLVRASFCKGQCTSEYLPDESCQCNPGCVSHQNCCSDYAESCQTCADRCDTGLNNDYPCQCNNKCNTYNDCCPDYGDICSGSDGTTDEELKEITAALFDLIDSPPVADLDIQFQGATHGGSTADQAPNDLISKLDEVSLFASPTFKYILPLMDNYIPDVRQSEDHSLEEQMEEDMFLDAVVDSVIMKRAIDFLIEKKYFTSVEGAKEKLRELWFQPYDRDGTSNLVLGSSGFEHVFIGEIKNGIVSGFHGWIHWYLEEQAGNTDYLGYIKTVDFGQNVYGLTDVFEWNGAMKAIGGGFVGTPPELDMAVFTICALIRSEEYCPAVFNNHQFEIVAFLGSYNGKQNIATSYPDFG